MRYFTFYSYDTILSSGHLHFKCSATTHGSCLGQCQVGILILSCPQPSLSPTQEGCSSGPGWGCPLTSHPTQHQCG